MRIFTTTTTIITTTPTPRNTINLVSATPTRTTNSSFKTLSTNKRKMAVKIWSLAVLLFL